MRDPNGNRWPRRGRVSLAAATGAFAVAGAACSDNHTVPEQPTWADVEPILRGSCTQCHGANAAMAGSSFRFDFYDVAPCGDAAMALGGATSAHGLASLIGSDVTPPGSGWRSRMPPAPGTQLNGWQRETVQRWARNPLRGSPLHANGRPDIQLQAATAVADKQLKFSALVSDPDGEPVVGVLSLGDVRLAIDRSGSFGTTLDTSKWSSGFHPISATLCDGWDSYTYDLGNVRVGHGVDAATPVPDAAPDVADAGAVADASSDASGDGRQPDSGSGDALTEAAAAAHE